MAQVSLALLAIGGAISGVQANPNSRVALSGNYTPTYIQCPSNVTFVRPASQGLPSGETQWLSVRKQVVTDAMQTYLTSAGVTGLNVSQFIAALRSNPNNVPTIALSFSGGGTRANLNGQGIYQALDARYAPALSAKTGGIAQAVTYVAGLSGGSIATGALGTLGFPTIASLIANGNENTSINPALFPQMYGKLGLGLNLTIGDLFGIVEAGNALMPIGDSTVNPVSWTWSGIRANPAFQNGSFPLPIHMLGEVRPVGVPGANLYQSPVNGTILQPTFNSTTFYEATPFEFGSYSGRVQAFTPIEFYGTTLVNGQPINQTCIQDYDNSAYLIGSSLTAMNLWWAEVLTNGTVGQFARRDLREPVHQDLEQRFAKRQIPYPADEATREQRRVADTSVASVAALPDYVYALQASTPQDILYSKVANPFYQLSGNLTSEGLSGQQQLYVVDASEGGQINPLWPLIRPDRRLDFAIISDNSGTELSSGWMNGTNFLNSYLTATAAGIPFPKLPSVNTFLNKNYTSRPTFFGCNEPNVPLLLYVADYPYTQYTNISFQATGLSNSQIGLLQGNAFAAITQNNNQLRSNWSSCLACGSVYRSLQRMNMSIPATCQQCMTDYCWQGDSDDSQPSFLSPSLLLNQSVTWNQWNASFFGGM